MKLFIKYCSVGVINTAIHWLIFLFCVYILNQNQSISNVIGFAIAVSFSYLVNSKYTFNTQYKLKSYLLYSLSMTAIAYLVGYLSDYINLPPILTLISFSLFSLVCGFCASLIIFNRQ